MRRAKPIDETESQATYGLENEENGEKSEENNFLGEDLELSSHRWSRDSEHVGVLKQGRLRVHGATPSLHKLEQRLSFMKYCGTLVVAFILLLFALGSNTDKGVESDIGITYQAPLADTFTSVGSVVIGMSNDENDLVLRFIAKGERKPRHAMTCMVPPNTSFIISLRTDDKEEAKKFIAEFTGCVVSESKMRVWYFFLVRLKNLTRGKTYKYTIEQMGDGSSRERPIRFDSKLRTLPAKSEDAKLFLVGDTGTSGVKLVGSHLASSLSQADLLVHVGDISYASDRGGCWASTHKDENCRYDCPIDNPKCEGRRRHIDEIFKEWETFFSKFGKVLEQLPIAISMGNHDNDLIWFFLFRPPHITSYPGVASLDQLPENVQSFIANFQGQYMGKDPSRQQALLNAFLSEPYYFSLRVGKFHLVSYQTEDNAVNPYERASNQFKDSPWREKFQERFDRHFGEKSHQLAWLNKTLGQVDRSVTPFVVVFTHRPLMHTSYHHPSCLEDGDWFFCWHRDMYLPLFEEHEVNLFVSGHSHHYMRSTPVHLDQSRKEIVVASQNDGKKIHPVLLIVGVGGYSLTKGFAFDPPWSLVRNDESFGFGILRVDDSAKMQWKMFSSVTRRQIDEATFA